MKRMICFLGMMVLSTSVFAQSPIQVTITGPGGHSNGDYGRVNAVHAASNAIVELDKKYPEYTVVNFNGGNSVNSIAGEAVFQVIVPNGKKRDEVLKDVSRVVELGTATENKFRNVKKGHTQADGTQMSILYTVK